MNNQKNPEEKQPDNIQIQQIHQIIKKDLDNNYSKQNFILPKRLPIKINIFKNEEINQIPSASNKEDNKISSENNKENKIPCIKEENKISCGVVYQNILFCGTIQGIIQYDLTKLELIQNKTKIEENQSWGASMFGEKKHYWQKEEKIIGIDVSKDGQWLAIQQKQNQKAIKLYQINCEEKIKFTLSLSNRGSPEILQNNAEVIQFGFGQNVLICMMKNQITLFSITDRREISQDTNNCKALGIARDGRYFAVAVDSEIHIVNCYKEETLSYEIQ